MLALPLAAAAAGVVLGDRPVSGWLSMVAALGSFAAALVAVFADDAPAVTAHLHKHLLQHLMAIILVPDLVY